MIKRRICSAVLESLKIFPVVSILGARQVGKTTLARQLEKHFPNTLFLDLERPSDVQKLENAELYLSQYTNHLVVIDEVQRMPSLFPLLRFLVDQQRTPGRFLLLGLTSSHLEKESSESLAGRIRSHHLSPLSLGEIANDTETTRKLWLRGGFPESFLSATDHQSVLWREAFVQTYVERDIVQLRPRVSSPHMRRFLLMLSHVHGQLLNKSTLSRSMGVSATTVSHYVDMLVESFLIVELQPFYTNSSKRLIKSPKIFFTDSGLWHVLQGIDSYEALINHASVGASWEGFVITQLLHMLPDRWQAYFYRTATGVEADLVLISPQQKTIMIEIKYSLSPKLSKGFWTAHEDLNSPDAYVIYPGTESYALKENVTMLPIAEYQRIFENVS